MKTVERVSVAAEVITWTQTPQKHRYTFLTQIHTFDHCELTFPPSHLNWSALETCIELEIQLAFQKEAIAYQIFLNWESNHIIIMNSTKGPEKENDTAAQSP